MTCNQIQDKASQTCQVCLLTNEILNAVFKKFSAWLLGKEVGWCCVLLAVSRICINFCYRNLINKLCIFSILSS